MTRPLRSPHDIKGISFDLMEPIDVEVPAPLRVQYLHGRGKRLVVAFAGVGVERGHTPPREFTSSASCGGENHVLFISDGSRSWLNAPGITDRIVELVERYCEFHNLTEVVALGNSMGGFSAIVLADLIPVRTVIAFSPQFSMHPNIVPEETRWSHFVDPIDVWSSSDVGAMTADDTTYFVFHGDNPWEARHWLRFPVAPRVYHYVFKGMGHAIAAPMRKRLVLPQVIAAAIAQRPRRLRKFIQRSPFGQRFELHQREAYQQEFPDVMQAIADPAPKRPQG